MAKVFTRRMVVVFVIISVGLSRSHVTDSNEGSFSVVPFYYWRIVAIVLFILTLSCMTWSLCMCHLYRKQKRELLLQNAKKDDIEKSVAVEVTGKESKQDHETTVNTESKEELQPEITTSTENTPKTAIYLEPISREKRQSLLKETYTSGSEDEIGTIKKRRLNKRSSLRPISIHHYADINEDESSDEGQGPYFLVTPPKKTKTNTKIVNVEISRVGSDTNVAVLNGVENSDSDSIEGKDGINTFDFEDTDGKQKDDNGPDANSSQLPYSVTVVITSDACSIPSLTVTDALDNTYQLVEPNEFVKSRPELKQNELKDVVNTCEQTPQNDTSIPKLPLQNGDKTSGGSVLNDFKDEDLESENNSKLSVEGKYPHYDKLPMRRQVKVLSMAYVDMDSFMKTADTDTTNSFDEQEYSDAEDKEYLNLSLKLVNNSNTRDDFNGDQTESPSSEREPPVPPRPPEGWVKPLNDDASEETNGLRCEIAKNSKDGGYENLGRFMRNQREKVVSLGHQTKLFLNQGSSHTQKTNHEHAHENLTHANLKEELTENSFFQDVDLNELFEFLD